MSRDLGPSELKECLRLALAENEVLRDLVEQYEGGHRRGDHELRAQVEQAIAQMRALEAGPLKKRAWKDLEALAARADRLAHLLVGGR